MRNSFRIASGRWTRFDRYELRLGGIAPAEGAALRHLDFASMKDPLKRLDGFVTGPDWIDPKNPDPAVLDAVLDWCRDFGVLGCLPHRLLEITLWPRWQSGALDDTVQPEQRTYTRYESAWLKRDTAEFGIFPGTAQLGSPLSEEDSHRRTKDPGHSFKEPGALLTELGGSDVKHMALNSGDWGIRFPSVPFPDRATFAYPLPGSDEFWRLYVEPLEEFVRAASLLTYAVREVAGRGRDYHAAALRLSILASHVAIDLLPERKGPPRFHIRTNTLLAALALSAIEDLSAGVLRLCDCGKLFKSHAYQAQYCSTKCRLRVNKRTYRAKKRKQGREARRKGQ